MHDIDFVKRLATGNDLLQTADGKSFREAPMEIQEFLQATSVRELEDAVVVAARLDDLHLLDHVLAVNHGEEDNLSAQ